LASVGRKKGAGVAASAAIERGRKRGGVKWNLLDRKEEEKEKRASYVHTKKGRRGKKRAILRP